MATPKKSPAKATSAGAKAPAKKTSSATKSTKKAAANKATQTVAKSKRTKLNRVRIRLQSYDHRLIDASAQKIVDVAKEAHGKVVGPIPLPTHRKIFCVNRAPHVDKKSREHFGLLTHKRLIDIIDPGQDFASQLSRLDLPAGVDIAVRL
jgi:small subunit ribosomal protein S10